MLSFIIKSDILHDNPNALRALEDFIGKNEDYINLYSLNLLTHNVYSSIPDHKALFQYWSKLEGFFSVMLNPDK
jgi:hypothetical protein